MKENKNNSQQTKRIEKIKIFSFFSGLGFLDLGFEKAGFDIAFVNEINPDFLSAYQYARRNSENIPEYGYSTLSIEQFLDNTVWDATFPHIEDGSIIGFIGGPPCPDFSAGGKNKGHTGKNGILTDIYVNLIIKRAPDFFVLENVKGLVQTKKHNEFYEKTKRRLYRAGYTVCDSMENAMEYGVPQNRDRLILVGFKRSSFGKRVEFKKDYAKKYIRSEILQKKWPKSNIFCEDGDMAEPDDIISDLTVEYWFRKNNVSVHPNAHDVFSVRVRDKFQAIEEGNVSGKSFKRLHRWRYSPTAAYGNNEVHLHPYKERRLSVAEALAIQSLPQDFAIPEKLPLSTKFKMVGNGVPFLLAKEIAISLFSFIHKKIGVEA